MLQKNAPYKLLFLISLLFLNGCSSTLSEPFLAVQAPSDKALVYIYSSPVLHKGFALEANGKEIAVLHGQEYYPYFADPGKIEFSTDLVFSLFEVSLLSAGLSEKSTMTLEVEVGKTYYLKGRYEGGVEIKYLHLSPVREEIGRAQIVNYTLAK